MAGIKANPVYVLTKSHGMVDGHTHKHYAQGSEFDPEKDAALIAIFFKSGASIEMKA